MKKTVCTIALIFALGIAAESQALLVVNQGFEINTAGWLGEPDGWAGTINQVPSGTGGITSSGGSFHAIMTQTDTVAAGGTTGPFSRFDGYRDTWTGGFTASIDIYLDTNWDPGVGFDYSVAANGTNNAHLRDYIFHVTKDTSTGDLLIGGDNNTNFAPREDLENINHLEVASSGWYTFEHSFYDAGGYLAVDLIVRDTVGTILFTETRSNTADIIPDLVGGNRYAWFTNIDIEGGIAVDNFQLDIASAPVPEPGTVALLGIGLLGLVGIRKKFRK